MQNHLRRFFRRLALVLFSCFLGFLVCAGATAHAAQKWIKLSSEHFDLFSCTSEGDSRQLLV
ncbi:MAG: hypothetical protein LBM04_10005, partial [Opitutaceae bacterium]|nr:hypothetical protein [Opitutaceae bacterium]